MEYGFNIIEAVEYGVDEAIMLKNFKHWIFVNRANNNNIYNTDIDGETVDRAWTYNTHKAFTEIFPFWTIKKIRRIISSLVDQKVIIKSHFGRDRCLWYALRDEESLLEEFQLPKRADQLPKRASSFAQTGNPSYTDNKPDSKPHNIYTFWNSSTCLIKHRSLSTKMTSSISKILKEYSEEEIKTAISNYGKILNSDMHYFNHKWRLDEFMTRGFEKFHDPDCFKTMLKDTGRKSVNSQNAGGGDGFDYSELLN